MIEEIITYAIIFTGFFLGKLFAKIAKEEITPGKKFFLFTRKVIYILLIILLLYYSRKELLILLIFILVGYFLVKIIKNNYLYLGSSLLFNREILISTLIFIFSLTEGTLTKKHKLILKNLVFFFVFPVILAIPLSLNISIFSAIAIGGFVRKLIKDDIPN